MKRFLLFCFSGLIFTQFSLAAQQNVFSSKNDENIFTYNDASFSQNITTKFYCGARYIFWNDRCIIKNNFTKNANTSNSLPISVPITYEVKAPEQINTTQPAPSYKYSSPQQIIYKVVEKFLPGPQGPKGESGVTTIVYQNQNNGTIGNPTSYINPGNSNHSVYQTTVPGDIWETFIHNLKWDNAVGNILSASNLNATNIVSNNITSTGTASFASTTIASLTLNPVSVGTSSDSVLVRDRVTGEVKQVSVSDINILTYLKNNVIASGTISYIDENGSTNTIDLTTLPNLQINGDTNLNNLVANNATFTNLSVPNTLSSFENILTSNIAGSQATSTIINSNSLIYSTTTKELISAVNGIVATTSLNIQAGLKYYAESAVDPQYSAPVASGNYSVAIGDGAKATQDSNIAMGNNSLASGVESSVFGRQDNTASGASSNVFGWANNIASNNLSNVFGYRDNVASGSWSSVFGWVNNIASGDGSAVFGWINNVASGNGSAIFGKENNIASAGNAIVFGYKNNQALADESNVFGHHSNTASGVWSNVFGWINNVASGDNSNVFGWDSNVASGNRANIFGFTLNNVSGANSSVFGYSNNNVTSDNVDVYGRDINTTNGYWNNLPSGSTAIGNSGGGVTVDNSGNVGIGIIAPSNKLTVEGVEGVDPVRLIGLQPGLNTDSVLVSSVDGVIKKTTATDLLASNSTNIVNYTGDESNSLVSTVNGVISTTTIGILNGLTLTGTTTASNVVTDFVQSALAYITNLLFDNATGTNLTVTGISNLANLISNNATITSLVVPNTLISTSNVLTSNVGGSISTSSIINLNNLNINGATVTSSVNGINSSVDLTGAIITSTTNTINYATNTSILTSIVNGKVATTTIGSGNSVATNTLTYLPSTGLLTSVVGNLIATTTINSCSTSSQSSSFSASLLSAQSIPTNVATVLLPTSKAFDTNNNFNTTNGRFTPNIAGKYILTVTDNLGPMNQQNIHYLSIRKNGVVVNTAYDVLTISPAQNFQGLSVTSIVEANGTTDYFDVVVQQNSGLSVSENTGTVFSGSRVDGGCLLSNANSASTTNTISFDTSTGILSSIVNSIMATSSLFGGPANHSSISVGTTTIQAGKVALFAGDIKVTGTIDPTRILFSGLNNSGSLSPTYTPSANGNNYSVRFEEGGNLNFQSNTTNNILQLNNNGQVGIGTSTPTTGYKLDVYGLLRTENGMLAANGNISTTNLGGTTAIGNDSSTIGWMNTTSRLDLRSGNAPFLTGLNNGNVGIGTTAPSAKLSVYEPGSSVGGWKGRVISGGDTSVVTIGESSSVATIGGHNAILSAWSNLAINPGGGNVGIGTTEPNYKLEVNGDINAIGNVRANGVILTSDERFKTNVETTTASNMLSKFMALNPVSYNWNELGQKQGGDINQLQHGFIAQQVAQQFPELVSTRTDGYKGVNYFGFIPMVVAITQDLVKKLEKMADEIVTKTIKSNTVKTEIVCVGNTCINEDQLKHILESSNTNTTTIVNSGSFATTTNQMSTTTEPMLNSTSTASSTSSIETSTTTVETISVQTTVESSATTTDTANPTDTQTATQ